MVKYTVHETFNDGPAEDNLMEPYPLVNQLPLIIETQNWEWKPFKRGERDFFVGIDEIGHAWLTKMRGSFYGYRELVFERLAQRAGWLCQSSSFAILERGSLPRRMVPGSERIQLVTRLLQEHGSVNCNSDCPINSFRGDLNHLSDDLLVLLAASPLEDALNLARKQILAPILGGNEPAGCLTTVDHRVFLIDGELMFSEEPSDVRETAWWKRLDGSPWPAGQRLTREICATVGSFQDNEIEDFLERPRGHKIKLSWPIAPLLYRARDCGRAFARSGN